MFVISHRGNDSHNYKENTIKALSEALKQNYIDGIELDIRITKDNKFVIYHNTSYLHMGIRKFIRNTKYKNLNNIDLLENLLKQVNTNKIILLEIKQEYGNNKQLTKNLLKLLNKYQYLNIWICSFNYKLVKEMTNKSKYSVGLIISDILNKNKDISDFDFVSLSKGAYNDIKTDKIKMIWTVNSNFNKYKSNYIITDKPYLVNKSIFNNN